MKSNILLKILLLSLVFIFTGCEDKVVQNSVKPYEGQTIMVIVPKLAGKTIRGPILEEAKVFEKQTGARIKVVTPSWAETIKITKESLFNDKINFDIFVIISSWGGSLLSEDNIAEVPQWVKEKIQWDDVLPIYKKSVLSWNNKTYALPYDGDCINLYYRKDIFNDLKNKQKFKTDFGYELNPPKTWKEFEDIASFFNGWDWDNDGKINYGIAGSRLKGYGTMLQFFTRAAAYAKHPENKGFYFNPTTMKPNINNDAFVKALEDYISVMKYAPNQIYKFSPGDVRKSFISGEVAMAIDWANMGTMSTNSEISVVKDKVGFAQLPGNDEVYNYKINSWDKQYNRPSSISGNWTLMVNKKSKNKKLAFEFASYMTSKEMTHKLTTQGWTGVNPSRYSHFVDPSSWTKMGFSIESAKEYLDVINKSLENSNVMVDIRIPGASRYYSAINKYIDLAIKGELKPKEALDKAAKQWENITDELDREKQLSLYNNSINN